MSEVKDPPRHDVPCRVSADLRRYQSQPELPMPPFDECDSDDLNHLLPERICKSLASLMLCRQSILLDKRVDTYNAEEAAKELMEKTEWLLKDLKILWMEEA